jgi:hypothetical protein
VLLISSRCLLLDIGNYTYLRGNESAKVFITRKGAYNIGWQAEVLTAVVINTTRGANFIVLSSTTRVGPLLYFKF